MSDPDTPSNRPATVPPPGPDTTDLAARIRRAQASRPGSNAGGPDARQGDMSGLARGLRIGTEFVAAILVGTGIGYLIDQVAGTGPWAMLVLFMLGFAAGILNVTRVVAELNAKSAESSGNPGDPS